MAAAPYTHDGRVCIRDLMTYAGIIILEIIGTSVYEHNVGIIGDKTIINKRRLLTFQKLPFVFDFLKLEHADFFVCVDEIS